MGISAKSDPKCHADAMEAGMNSFVAKPFRLQELIEIMENSRRTPSSLPVVAAVDHPPTAGGAAGKPTEVAVDDK